MLYNLGSGSWLARANGAAAKTAAIQLHALTYNWTSVMQLANTPPLRSTTPGLQSVSIHQTSPLVRGSKHPITACYSIYRPRKHERLSRPAWLVTYRNKVPPPGVEPVHFTHPRTNRARCRVTSLIRPTLLPLRHAAAMSVQWLRRAGWDGLACWLGQMLYRDEGRQISTKRTSRRHGWLVLKDIKFWCAIRGHTCPQEMEKEESTS